MTTVEAQVSRLGAGFHRDHRYRDDNWQEDSVAPGIIESRHEHAPGREPMQSDTRVRVVFDFVPHDTKTFADEPGAVGLCRTSSAVLLEHDGDESYAARAGEGVSEVGVDLRLRDLLLLDLFLS